MNLQNMTQIKLLRTGIQNPDQTISKWPQIQYLVFQYDDNTEYKFIGRSFMSRYPMPLRSKWTSKTWRKSNLLHTRIETPDQTISKWLEIQYLVLQYDDNTDYKFIGCFVMSWYPNPLRPKWSFKTRRICNLLRTRIETWTKRSPNDLKFKI